jgi:hypothetical protein
MSVKTPHPEYDEYLPTWEMAEALIKGQRAVQAMGETFLPKLKDEKVGDYKARLKRSNYFNATWRAIAGMSGMAFRKDPAMFLPPAIEGFASDINMAGVSLTDFAKEMVEEVLGVGRMGLLVDHPPKPLNVTSISEKAAELAGLRPYIKSFEACQIINWRFARRFNSWTLALVVLREEVDVSTSEFGHESECQYRVLDLDENGLYRQRVYRVEEVGGVTKDILLEGPIYPLRNSQPLRSIPFCFVGTGGKGDDIDEPPLIDLMDLNVAHYQINSDWRHGLHFTGLPTAVVSGHRLEKGDQLYIGSKSAWVFDNPNTSAKYIEFTGQGLQATKEALQELKQEMAVVGARALADESTKAVETLGATEIKRAGETGILAATVLSVSKAIEWALCEMRDWIGASGDVVFQINRNFMPNPMTPAEAVALMNLWLGGALSEQELLDKLKDGEIIMDSDKTLERHQEEIGSNPPGAAAAA